MKFVQRILSGVLCLVVFAAGAVLSFAVTAGKMVQKGQAPLHVEWNPSVGQIHADLAYGEGEFHTYDLYVPGNPKPGQTFRLILLIHGGGFTGGDRKDDAVWGKYFAANGCVVASVNYTLMSADHPVGLPVMFQDIRDAVKAICTKSAELGFPLAEMAVTGTSAGATLALMYAYNPPEDSPLPVRFVFEQSGPVSFHPAAWGGGEDGDPTELAAAASGWTGRTISADMVESGAYMQDIDAISPVTFVTGHSVPTLMAYGPHDRVVPPIHRELLLRALEANHVPHACILFPHSGHALRNDPDQLEVYLRNIQEYAARYFQTPVS